MIDGVYPVYPKSLVVSPPPHPTPPHPTPPPHPTHTYTQKSTWKDKDSINNPLQIIKIPQVHCIHPSLYLSLSFISIITRSGRSPQVPSFVIAPLNSPLSCWCIVEGITWSWVGDSLDYFSGVSHLYLSTLGAFQGVGHGGYK